MINLLFSKCCNAPLIIDYYFDYSVNSICSRRLCTDCWKECNINHDQPASARIGENSNTSPLESCSGDHGHVLIKLENNGNAARPEQRQNI